MLLSCLRFVWRSSIHEVVYLLLIVHTLVCNNAEELVEKVIKCSCVDGTLENLKAFNASRRYSHNYGERLHILRSFDKVWLSSWSPGVLPRCGIVYGVLIDLNRQVLLLHL